MPSTTWEQILFLVQKTRTPAQSWYILVKERGGRYQKYITFHFITFHFVTPPFIHHNVNPQTPWGISATLTHTHTHIYAAIYWTRRDRKIQRAAFICCGVLSSWMLLRLTHGVDILIPAVESGQFLLQVGFSIISAPSGTLLARGSTPLLSTITQ